MFYSLLLVALVAAAVFGAKHWRTLPVDKRAAFLKKAILYGSAAIILVLVLAGRAPWLMGILAALLAVTARLAQFAAYVPVFKKIFGDDRPPSAAAPSAGVMTRDKAAETLGVDIDASPDEIKLAHKKLMQKMHPDRGGSELLAKQINQAKDILLS